MDRKRLYLIDGMSHIYRAYYAIRDLRTSKGLPTNSIYGFTTMLRKLIQEEKPDYLAVAFDLDGPTVRRERFGAYKATRKPMPEDLMQQLPYIRRVCEAFRVPVIGFEGYEADDVIGTLTVKAVEQGLKAIIVTSDKDMLQLVSDHVVVLDPAKDNMILDAQKVVEKLGVNPDQVCDLLGLWGDTSDNIPGAPGIGEKGARELIQTFGTLENSLANWDKVKRKTYQESLRDNAELIRTSYELACIKRDLPIELNLDTFRLSEPDRKNAFELFAELEFKAQMREFLDEESKAVSKPEWRSGEAAIQFLEGLTGQPRIYFALDYSEGVLARKIAKVVCIQGETGPAALIDLKESGRAWTALIQNPSVTKICWDAKLCRLAQAANGACNEVAVEDVMLLAFLTAPHIGNYTLRGWALEQLHMNIAGDEGREEGLLPTEEQRAATAESLGREVTALRQLYELLSISVNSLGLRRVYQEIELPLVPLLAEMESTGVRIDPGMLQKMSETMQKEIDDLTGKIFTAAGTEFNINSTRQIGEILFERMNLPVLKKTRKTGGYSTDQAVLEELAVSYEIARLILDYRQITKLKSTYVDSLPALIHPETGRVHTSYHQTGAATGRISSSDPNLQNIPIRTELGRLIRGAFIAGEGNILISADYSQVELRVMAHLSGDESLVEAFRNNDDIHARTAEEVFGLQYKMNPSEYRRRAKVINFGIIYGLSAFGLAAKLGIGRHEAQAFIDAYFQRYHGVRAWLEKTLDEARRTGMVRTLFGRLRPIPDIRSKDFNARSFAERAAINSPIQGTAADIMKLAMMGVRRAFLKANLSAKIIMQVHDELVFELPGQEAAEVEALARAEMENAVALQVPLVVDVYRANNWKDMK